MTSTKKSKKSAKTTAASKKAETATKTKAVATKGSTAKGKTGKGKVEKSTARAKTAATARAAASTRTTGAKAASRKQAASAARSATRTASASKTTTSRRKAAVAKAAKDASGVNAVKTGAVKAAAKSDGRKIAKTIAKTIAKADAKTIAKVVKSEKSRANAVVRETAQENIRQSQSKKAQSDIKTNKATTNPKPVEQAGARQTVNAAKPEMVASPKPETPAPSPMQTAPDPRPASSAPVVQPRETSEQIPVTQKKTTPPAAAKPAKPVARPQPAEAARPAAAVAPKAPKPSGQKLGFKTSEHIVYPAHGVGQIVAIEEQEVAGFKLELFVISFAKDKMILKVPTPKVVSVGMRKLAEAPVIARSLETLTGRARIKRTMWSRRAQEYEAKINSGDLIAIAEVVRDLYRSEAQPEQSYSERQLYEAALDRMSRELAVVQKITETESLKLIESQLQKGPRRSAKADAETEAEGDADTGDIDEAA